MTWRTKSKQLKCQRCDSTLGTSWQSTREWECCGLPMFEPYCTHITVKKTRTGHQCQYCLAMVVRSAAAAGR